MFDRADHSGRSVGARLDAAVAGKNDQCNEVEAAELVSCVRVGEENALDVLSGGKTLQDAIDDLDTTALSCMTLRSDMRCMQRNPCFTWYIRDMPIQFNIDNTTNKWSSEVCQEYHDVQIMDNSTITWGVLCNNKVGDVCEMLYNAIDEVKADYDECGVTCHGDIADEEAHLNATSTVFTRVKHWDQQCADDKKITTKKDCENAAKELVIDDWSPTWKEFKAIRYQPRPAGCYEWEGTVWWNAVRKGTFPVDKRYPICAN